MGGSESTRSLLSRIELKCHRLVSFFGRSRQCSGVTIIVAPVRAVNRVTFSRTRGARRNFAGFACCGAPLSTPCRPGSTSRPLHCMFHFLLGIFGRDHGLRLRETGRTLGHLRRRTKAGTGRLRATGRHFHSTRRHLGSEGQVFTPFEFITSVFSSDICSSRSVTGDRIRVGGRTLRIVRSRGFTVNKRIGTARRRVGTFGSTVIGFTANYGRDRNFTVLRNQSG